MNTKTGLETKVVNCHRLFNRALLRHALGVIKPPLPESPSKKGLKDCLSVGTPSLSVGTPKNTDISNDLLNSNFFAGLLPIRMLAVVYDQGG